MKRIGRSGWRCAWRLYASSASSKSGTCTGVSTTLIVQSFARLVAFVEGVFDLLHLRCEVGHGYHLVNELLFVIMTRNQQIELPRLIANHVQQLRELQLAL